MTRRLFLAVWLITAMLVSGAAQAATRTRAQALSLVKEKYASRDVDIYYLEDDPASPGLWRFFVDANPMAGWEHECYVVTLPKTVSSSGTGLAQIEMRMPPAEMRTPAEVKNRLGDRCYDRPQLPKNTSINDPFSPAGKRTYAVILNGGLDAPSNHYRYWNNCSYMYQILTRKVGVPRNQIYVLMSDGTSSEPDMLGPDGLAVSSDPDLDGDNYPDVQYAATLANVKSVLAEVASKIEEGDHLFIFVTGHGAKKTRDTRVSIWLWNYEKLPTDILAACINPILEKDAGVSLLLAQCYSGGFIDNLKAAGCVVATATNDSKPSYPSTEVPYDEFAYHWMNAVNGATPYGDKVNADTNEDSTVSMKEAFEYARSHDKHAPTGTVKDLEEPQFSATPNHIGFVQALSAPLTPVALYISTAEDDYGLYTPANDSHFWASPALYVRNVRNPTPECDIPYYSRLHPQAYVYTLIGNRGWRSYTGGQQLHLYWHEGATCVTPNGWLGREKDHGIATGGKIGTVKLTAEIAPGSRLAAVLAWDLPSEVFSSPAGQNVSLLANIRDDSADDAIPSSLLFYTFNAAENPKTAQRSTTSLAAPAGGASIRRDLRFTNLMSTEARFNLDLRPHTEADKALFDTHRVELFISPDLYNQWVQGGAKFNKAFVSIAHGGERSITMFTSDSSIENIPAAPGSFSKIGIALKNFSNTDMTEGPYHIDLVQTNMSGSVFGGVDVVAMNTAASASGISVGGEDTQEAILTADLTEEEQVLGWFDGRGELIGNGEEVAVCPGRGNSRYTVITARDSGNAQYSATDMELPGRICRLERKGDGLYEVVLNEPAKSPLQLLILSGLTAQPVSQAVMTVGEKSCAIDLADSPDGTYIAVMLDNDVITDTWKFNKE